MKITQDTLKQLIKEELKGRDNPVLYKANQIEHYVKLLQQAARSGNADHRASSIQAIKDLLTQIEGV